MLDARRSSVPSHILRFAWLTLAVYVGASCLRSGAAKLEAPTYPIKTFRGEPAPPEVFARGILRGTLGSGTPALCAVRAERLGGPTSVSNGSMHLSNATLDVEWSSSPLPASMKLPTSFMFELGPERQRVDAARAADWRRRAQAMGIDLRDKTSSDPSIDPIFEQCLDAGERVFIRACVSPSDAGWFAPCPGSSLYYVTMDERIQPEIDQAARQVHSSVATRVGCAFFALLAGLLAFVRHPTPLIQRLEARTPPRRRRLTVNRVRIAVVAVGLSSFPLSISTDIPPLMRAPIGFVWGAFVLTLWLLTALERRSHRSRILAALALVRETPRSLLADAKGTVELAVRARVRGDGVRSFIGDDVVAFSELRVTDVCTMWNTNPMGGSPASREVRAHREGDALEIVDESGDGVLQLRHAIVDTELRSRRMRRLPPHCRERGIAHSGTTSWYHVVEERVIRDGEPLYVLGEVGDIEPRPSANDYRSTKGSPTLGGSDATPLIVYSGGERGLLAMLASRARIAGIFSVAMLAGSAVLVAALAYLALR